MTTRTKLESQLAAERRKALLLASAAAAAGDTDTLAALDASMQAAEAGASPAATAVVFLATRARRLRIAETDFIQCIDAPSLLPWIIAEIQAAGLWPWPTTSTPTQKENANDEAPHPPHSETPPPARPAH